MQTRTEAGRDGDAESHVTTCTCDKDFLLCFLSLHSVHLSHLRLGLNDCAAQIFTSQIVNKLMKKFCSRSLESNVFPP